MELKIRKFIFYIFWFLSLVIPFITVFRNSPINTIFSNEIVALNVVQRISGLLLFTLISMQIILGSNMDWWLQVFGSKAYRVHIVQGLFIYGLALFHPLMEVSIVYKISESLLDALYVFVPSIKSTRDIYLIYGRSALIFLTIGVLASYFRTMPFLRKNWKVFHIINYLVFYAVYFHMRVGSDIMTWPFSWFSWVALTGVTASVINKYILRNLFHKFKGSKNAEIVKQKA